MKDETLIALGLHYQGLADELRAEMVRTAENNPDAKLEDFVADIARRFRTLQLHGLDDMQPAPPASWTVVHSENGAVFTPWTNGWSVGFAVSYDDGRPVEYVYLNPSGGSDDDKDTVFLYQGPDGDPACDAPFVHAVIGDQA